MSALRLPLDLLRGCAVAALGAAACCTVTHAADAGRAYPDRPVRLIVPYPPGGGTDFVARAVARKLSESWGQQVVVDNRGGAGGVIGSEIAARAAADGYTLLFGTAAGMVINPLLNSKLSYDPVRDFAPVTQLVDNPQLLAVNNALAVHSVKELIALAKSEPAKLNYASAGPGTPNHLGMEQFKMLTGTQLAHVPYKGAGPAITDLLGGQVQVMLNPISALLPLTRSGKLRALAVGSAQRSRAAPELPTVAEAGVPGFENVPWYAFFVPAKTPAEIVRKLNAETVRVLAEPDLVQLFTTQGTEPRGGTPEELAAMMRAETERTRQIIRAAGMKVE